MRGENNPPPHRGGADLGTSPRARGKRAEAREKKIGMRNIPACAGKTVESGNSGVTLEEHPRVRGENGGFFAAGGGGGGNIPACAGKTTHA